MKNLKLTIPVLASVFCCGFFSCTNKTNTATQTAVAKDSTKANNSMSVYQLDGKWTTQDYKTITLADLQGKVQVVAMVFTHCRYACPRITGDMKNIEKYLPADLKGKVGFTLVSFDTERDTVARLKQFAREMGLDSNWTILRGNEEEVRALSMLLNVNYERLQNGDYNHTSVITILGTNGVVIYRHEGLEMDAHEVAEQVAKAFKC